MKQLATLFFCLSLIPASAQTTSGTIAGVVTAPDGRAQAGAKVTLTRADTGAERSADASVRGEFVFALLPAGEYRLMVRASGQAEYERRIQLLVNQEVRIEVGLVAQRRDVTEVTEVRSLLKPDSASLGATIDNRLVTGLPLDGRNFLDLSLLVPGAVPAAQGSASSSRGDFALSVNGAREDGNNFLLDGVYNGDPKLNTFGVNTAVDAIREFEVLTSTYDASFGRNGGAQINVVLKSGTNQIHGSAYEFFRNAALDGSNYFAPAGTADPRNQRNQFGATIGAPVKKNRTFVFGDFEGRRVNEGITRVTNVPTAAERTGDFSRSGLPYLIDLFTQQPFPGTRIPRERMHPIGGALANLYPLPNRAVRGQNFVSSPILRDRNDQFDARLDHKIASRDDLAVRYSFANRNYFEPFGNGNATAIPGNGNEVPRRAQNFMAAETHAFSPMLLNEFRLAFTRVASQVLLQNRAGQTNASFGLPAPANPRDAGLTSISVPGYSSLGDEGNNPQLGTTNAVQVLDTATWVRGRHLVRFGFDYRHLTQDAFRDVQSRGFLTFVGFTGNALAELLQGIVSASGVAKLDNPQALRTASSNFFANDSWRVAPRLTLNLGLRYEYNSPAVDANDRANLYDPSRGGLLAVGKNGFPRSGYGPDRNNFAPRAGFAYQAASKTLLRGGYGVYFDQSPLAPGEGLYFSAPYFDFRLFFFSQQAPLLLHNPFPANAAVPYPPSATAFQRNLRTGYMQHWNINVQQQVGSASVLEIGYVGSKGTKLLSARDLNQAGPSAAEFNLRPNPYFGDINVLESRGNSNYQALQGRFQQRFSHGLSALASYSWSKSIDDASGFFSSTGDPNFPQDSRNVRLERARSNFDVRQRLSLSYAYDLPLGKGRWLGGWQTFGIWSFQTGRPFTVALSPDNDNSGTGRSSLGFGNNDRPNYLRNATLLNPTPERWFDTAAFAIPARGNFGNAGRNILDGPGLAQINASVVKNFAIAESRSLQFRAELFNLTNRTNFDLPDLTVESPTFGRISSAQSPRRVQFGLKFLF